MVFAAVSTSTASVDTAPETHAARVAGMLACTFRARANTPRHALIDRPVSRASLAGAEREPSTPQNPSLRHASATVAV